MKVYINKYRHHWLSPYTILEKVFFWREIEYDEVLIDRLSSLLEPLCRGLQKVFDIIHPKVDYIKIDKWDTWSMDATLAKIILPMLKQLRDTKHGAPNVDDEDVPEELRSTVPAAEQAKENEWDVDGNHFKRWDYVLGEMIWAFEQKNDDYWQDIYYSGVADYVHVESEEVHPTYGKLFTLKPGPNHTQTIDWDGMKAHQERMTNGFKLFGKYYEGLWD